jgi:predicted acylesterase/phospholipase RssA
MGAQAKFWTLSFSGAGLLLPYHLGAARVLRDSLSSSNAVLPIRAVAGSSSGAIAATFMSLLPHRLEEYTDRFLHDGGGGLSLVKEMLEEEVKAPPSSTTAAQDLALLYVCTTKSSDGSMHLFEYDPKDNPQTDPNLFRAIHASCMIPKSFHPFDVFSREKPSYPDGIEIGGVLYCDGGIASPAPSTPMDDNPNCVRNIVVSPISGPESRNRARGGSIRPKDRSLGLPFAFTSRCGSFRVNASLQNLKAAFGSIGATTPEALRDWHDRGAVDAEMFLESVNERSE